MSVAELSEVDGADKAGLSGCNQSQMWSGPRHGGPTTSAVSGGDGGGGGRGHSWMTSDPEKGTTSQGWQLPWTRQTTCYHLVRSRGLRLRSKSFGAALFHSATFKYLQFIYLLGFFFIRNVFITCSEMVALKCPETIITSVSGRGRLQYPQMSCSTRFYMKHSYEQVHCYTFMILPVKIADLDVILAASATAFSNCFTLLSHCTYLFHLRLSFHQLSLYTSKLRSNRILKRKKRAEKCKHLCWLECIYWTDWMIQ